MPKTKLLDVVPYIHIHTRGKQTSASELGWSPSTHRTLPLMASSATKFVFVVLVLASPSLAVSQTTDATDPVSTRNPLHPMTTIFATASAPAIGATSPPPPPTIISTASVPYMIVNASPPNKNATAPPPNMYVTASPPNMNAPGAVPDMIVNASPPNMNAPGAVPYTNATAPTPNMNAPAPPPNTNASAPPPNTNASASAPSPSVALTLKHNNGKNNLRLKLAIGLATAAVLVVVIALLVYCFWIRSMSNTYFFSSEKNKSHRNVEAILKTYGSLPPKRYTYSEVKKFTNSFENKLGEGGYGGVYKGTLPDSRAIAVKVLKESKGSGEEFINEVASISRTSHVNIVTLMGFCFERTKRALVYEFMPNGSLEKFIYDANITSTTRQLGWETLFQIALGIARGLEYLHRGCNTRIVHFDIKPHNILLDEEFCPKIADFGLSKLCSNRKDSILSMLGARGTPGYTAPEVFCRSVGNVSHKSDVYSYGMMVLEMVGGRKNIDVGADHTSEIYFPHWIHGRLHRGSTELELHGIVDEEEKVKARKMIIIGLWCIQTDPNNRPAMDGVLDMFQGSIESLQIPPLPVMSSSTTHHS